MPESVGPVAVPKFQQLVGVLGMRGHVVHQNHAARAVHLGVGGFSAKVAWLVSSLPRRRSFRRFLRLVPQDQHDFVFDVDPRVVVVVKIGGGDAVTANTTCPENFPDEEKLNGT